MKPLSSAIYSGTVGHCRYHPRLHRFHYAIFLFALDLDTLEQLPDMGVWFKIKKTALMSFNPQDYLYRSATITSAQVWQKVSELGGENAAGQVIFVGQVRCLGVYFSPVNFYYCHTLTGDLRYLLAEVSNTPWHERHYYLIDATTQHPTPKSFHVSPFMHLDMDYHWRFSALNTVLQLHIANHTATDKLFEANLLLQRQPLDKAHLRRQWLRIPAMTLKTVAAIYWQALRLFLKKVPYVPYSKKSQEVS